MSGGEGSRLMPLTKFRSKPAVYVWGTFRLIDASVNSIGRQCSITYILPQYQVASQIRHIEEKYISGRVRTANCSILTPQITRTRKRWYEGTADSVRHNIDRVQYSAAENVIIGAGDHLYTFMFEQPLQDHQSMKGDLTVLTLKKQLKREDFDRLGKYRFGVLEVNPSGRVKALHEKVENPPQIKNRSGSDTGFVFVSMGIYVFKSGSLFDSLNSPYSKDGKGLGNDFGSEIIPGMLRNKKRFMLMFMILKKMALGKM